MINSRGSITVIKGRNVHLTQELPSVRTTEKVAPAKITKVNIVDREIVGGIPLHKPPGSISFTEGGGTPQSVLGNNFHSSNGSEDSPAVGTVSEEVTEAKVPLSLGRNVGRLVKSFGAGVSRFSTEVATRVRKSPRITPARGDVSAIDRVSDLIEEFQQQQQEYSPV